jgi:ankyrin repeat protein
MTPLLRFLRVIASRDAAEASRMLGETPELAATAMTVGASRKDPRTYFLSPIGHYVYAGDTALHVAAAAYQRDVAELLVATGADVRARNRRGAEPLHYAADGSPGAGHWDPLAQHAVVEYLVSVGSDPDAFDKSGVAPLHRAVRTRCTAAVRALLDCGAEPRLMNKSGSTPLHLAVQNTGRGTSGADAAKSEQREIIALLLAHGARPSDVDAKGKSVADAATSDWITELLLAT